MNIHMIHTTHMVPMIPRRNILYSAVYTLENLPNTWRILNSAAHLASGFWLREWGPVVIGTYTYYLLGSVLSILLLYIHYSWSPRDKHSETDSDSGSGSVWVMQTDALRFQVTYPKPPVWQVVELGFAHLRSHGPDHRPVLPAHTGEEGDLGEGVWSRLERGNGLGALTCVHSCPCWSHLSSLLLPIFPHFREKKKRIHFWWVRKICLPDFSFLIITIMLTR